MDWYQPYVYLTAVIACEELEMILTTPPLTLLHILLDKERFVLSRLSSIYKYRH